MITKCYIQTAGVYMYMWDCWYTCTCGTAGIHVCTCACRTAGVYMYMWDCWCVHVHAGLLVCTCTCGTAGIHVCTCTCGTAGIHVCTCGTAGIHVCTCTRRNAGIHVRVCTCTTAGNMYVHVHVHAWKTHILSELQSHKGVHSVVKTDLHVTVKNLTIIDDA